MADRTQYKNLTVEHQRKMAQAALLQLEQQHFEAIINAVIHKLDGAALTQWKSRKEAIAQQIALLKREMGEYLVEPVAESESVEAPGGQS